jgi:signal transduction histidine kinase
MTTQPQQSTRFISLRWRFIYPLFAMILVVAMVSAYAVASNMTGGLQVSQTNALLQSSRAAAERAAELYNRHRTEAERIAFTVGVGEAIRARQAETLHGMLESLARLANLDSVILTDATGLEVVGLQRVLTQGDYAVSTGTDLSGQPVIRGVLDEGFVGAVGLIRTPEGLMLYTAVPVFLNAEQVGIALVGGSAEAVLAELKGGALADVVLYGPDGAVLQTTFEQPDTLRSLSLPPEVFNQVLSSVGQVPVQTLNIGGTAYQGAYFAFSYGPSTLGVVGTLMPDDLPFATEIGRQMVALMASALAGAAVIAAFIGISRFSNRVERVTRAAQALAAGQGTTRTGMKAVDEIGAMGRALDQYADYAQEKQDELRVQLRRQRREVTHLVAVMESIPDGVVVQDLDGRVVLMNEQARGLLGSQRVFRSSGLHELTAVVTDVLGPSLAPGLYALGDPQRIGLDDKMLSAQAAAVMSTSDNRLGTVIVLRDISEQVRQERAREALLGRLMEDIQQPIANMARSGITSQTPMVSAFAREMTRHAVALQKMIVDMRELTDASPPVIQRAQKAIRLETLVWAVANEWRQVAQAANLTLHIIIERKGLYVLGDERRLRWAMGNIVDNAIKYTPPGGALTLEIQEEFGTMGRLRVRDNGVGIAPDELPHVFTRFYRGNPVTKAGRVIRVPGMGQGLSVAKQIFEAHGGGLQIKSNQWIGTAVYMALPLTAGDGFDLPRIEDSDMDGETVLLDKQKPIDVEIE